MFMYVLLNIKLLILYFFQNPTKSGQVSFGNGLLGHQNASSSRGIVLVSLSVTNKTLKSLPVHCLFQRNVPCSMERECSTSFRIAWRKCFCGLGPRLNYEAIRGGLRSRVGSKVNEKSRKCNKPILINVEIN